MGSRIAADLIRGMGKRDDHFLLIIDISRAFTADEMRAANAGSLSQV